jgi:membrane protein DedA with SNARE-associated domain
METALSTTLDFISAHRGWAGPLAFLLALGETIAVVSLLIPATAIFAGLGVLVAAGKIHFMPIFLGGALGAIVGGTVSWWLGARYGDRMLAIWPLNRDPQHVERGRAAFARWGLLAIFIGHFFGPLRAVVFLLAGMARVSALRFQAVNIAGSVGWAFLIPKSGQVGGNALGYFWRLLTGG